MLSSLLRKYAELLRKAAGTQKMVIPNPVASRAQGDLGTMEPPKPKKPPAPIKPAKLPEI